MTSISIVIPTFNRSASLRRAIRSLAVQDFPRTEYEILIVDNASTDATRVVVDEEIRANPGHAIRYIHEPVPGLLPARHRGAAVATGAILSYLDDDIEADRNWLAAIHDAFREPGVHLVGGRNLPKYEAPPPSWIERIWVRNSDHEYCVYLSLLDMGKRRRVVDAIFVWGLNFSIRRETLYQLGGFHPDSAPARFQRYVGDGETGLALRVNESGLKAMYEPAALVHHFVPAERMTVEYIEKRLYFQGVCDSYTTIRKNREFGFTINPTAFPDSPDAMLEYRMGTALMNGYNWHQQQVKDDPRLLQWVLREDYFDYRYPE